MKKIIVLLLVALLLVGCADKEIVGRWYEEATGSFLLFNEDGTCEFSTYVVEYEAEDGVLIMYVDGEEQTYNYEIEGDHLDLTIPGIDDFEMHFDRLN